jgi:hypothetical protein
VVHNPQTRPAAGSSGNSCDPSALIADLDSAGPRDPEALNRLPEGEHKACRALWADVDALLAKVRGSSKQ